jgi:hypothetical protein
VADFAVLADTSHRLHPPGRTHDEARALLSMAVLLENAQVRTGRSSPPGRFRFVGAHLWGHQW